MLTVNKIEPTIVNKLVDKTARDGNNVIFECSVDDPEQDMIWQLNGNQISANREFDINAGNGHHRLAFKALEKYQGAMITCKMDQSNFSKWNWSPRDIQTETSAMLTVQIPDGKLSQIKNFLEKSQISYRQNDLLSTWYKFWLYVNYRLSLSSESGHYDFCLPNANWKLWKCQKLWIFKSISKKVSPGTFSIKFLLKFLSRSPPGNSTWRQRFKSSQTYFLIIYISRWDRRHIFYENSSWVFRFAHDHKFAIFRKVKNFSLFTSCFRKI